MGSTRVNKSICISFPSEVEYGKLVKDKKAFRTYLNKVYHQDGELFPAEMKGDFKFNGYVESKKQQITIRRIQLLSNQEVYQIRPSFVMPYMIERTEKVEKALYLLRYGVPFDAIVYVFGRNAMFWYRAYISFGRASIVGTTVKDASKMPINLVADEKHTWLNGKRVYAATTAAKGCILGVSLAQDASGESLTKAYREFKQEAEEVVPNYSPETVNTDGWEGTQNAWKALFPAIITILCFLHSFLKIRDRCRRFKELGEQIKSKVWDAYHSKTKAQFSQRIRRLKQWALKNEKLTNTPVLEKILSLCQKAPQFKLAFDLPDAYRTSNQIDRLMNYQDRILYSMQYFHGNKNSARLYLRSMALIWNFHPYCSRTQSKDPTRASPFEDLNGFHYHPNWLHNLLIASSLGGHRK